MILSRRVGRAARVTAKVSLDFDLKDIATTQFGAWKKDGEGFDIGVVDIDSKVRDKLQAMVRTTLDAMEKDKNGPKDYDPAEKHGSPEYLITGAGAWDPKIRAIHDADNLKPDQECLSDPDALLGYFAQLTDGQGRRLTALRKAQQFKGILKRTMLRFIDDALRIVPDTMFKLDNDFDLLMDAEWTHILRPGAFEALADLEKSVLAAVPSNVQKIETNLPFVDFKGIETYAKQRPRAARYLASIRQQRLAGMSKDRLKDQCTGTGAGFDEEDGRIVPTPGQEMAFLQVLDRRRYTVELIPDEPEPYAAASRERVE